jgi:hypothetical protein
MKKIISILILNSFVYVAIADEFPYVHYFLSKDSTVWFLVSRNGYGSSDILYKIKFDNSGEINWGEEKDSTIYNKINTEYRNYIKHCYSINDHTQLKIFYDKKNKLSWAIRPEWSDIEKRNENYLCFTQSNYWEKVYKIPAHAVEITDMHIGDNGNVWLGGYAFVGYYKNKTFTRFFFTDGYELQNTDIYLCAEGNACPEEKAPKREDYDNEEDYEEAYREWDLSIGGDGYPISICFCDGRKIGFIDDNDGYVNFRTEPNTTSSIIGIILSGVRIFYWENEKNNWWKVEINGEEGFVHKSRIKPQQNERTGEMTIGKK